MLHGNPGSDEFRLNGDGEGDECASRSAVFESPEKMIENRVASPSSIPVPYLN